MLEYLLGKNSVDQLPNSYNTASTFDCKMRLPNGNVVLFNVMPCDDYLEGANGHVAVNRNGIRGKFVDDLKSRPAHRQWLEAEVAKLYRGMPIQGHMANFFYCIKTRQKPISDVWSHCNSMNACHMANIAMLLGRKVRWDVQKKQFIDDAEANQLMHRPQRHRTRSRCRTTVVCVRAFDDAATAVPRPPCCGSKAPARSPACRHRFP